MEEAEWIQCTKEMKAKRKAKPQKMIKVNVEKVETDWVGVHWQCRAYSKDGAWSDQAQPKFVVEGEDLKKLKLLNIFEPSTVQVGDRNFYIIKGNENVITREQWRKQQRDIFRVPKQSPKKTRPNITVTKLPDDKKKEQKNDKTLDQQSADEDDSDSVYLKNVMSNLVAASLLEPPKTKTKHAESSDEWDTEDTMGSQSDSASVNRFAFSFSAREKPRTRITTCANSLDFERFFQYVVGRKEKEIRRTGDENAEEKKVTKSEEESTTCPINSRD